MNEWFLPPLRLTKDFVAASGEEKVYLDGPGGVKVPLGDCQSTRSWQSFSHWTTSILLPKQSFLVRSSNYASGLPANEDTTPFILSGSFLSLFIERTKFTYTRVRKTFPTRNFPLFFDVPFDDSAASLEKKGEGQGSLGQKSVNYQFEFRKHQISPSRIRTYDQSVNSRPLYH